MSQVQPVPVLQPVPLVLAWLLVRWCRSSPLITLRLYRAPRSTPLKSEVLSG